MASATSKDVPKVDKDTGTFVVAISKASGLDPRVVYSWVTQEGAYAPNGTGAFNFLNVRPTAQGGSYSGVPVTVSSGGFEQFKSVDDAVTETVNRLRQPFAADILAAGSDPKATPKSEISAIAGTGWDAAHYGGSGGPNLANKFISQWGSASLDNPSLPPGKITISPDFSGGSASVTPPDQVDRAKPYTPGKGDSLGDALGSFWGSLVGSGAIRLWEVLGGLVMIYLGIKMLGQGGVPAIRGMV